MIRSVFAALLLPSMALAAPLATQGRLIDPAGGPINGTHSLTVQIFDSPVGGSELWSMPFDDLAIQDGYYSLVLDGSDSAGRALDTAVTQEAWMLLSVDGSPMLPRQVLQAVPQSVRSMSAETASQADHALTADEAVLSENAVHADTAGHAETAALADEALTALEAGRATSADHADTAGLADEALTALEAGHATTADHADTAALADEALTALEAGHANTADHADTAALADESLTALEAETATVAQSVPVIDATEACGSPGLVGYDPGLTSGAICDGSAWQVLQSATAAQGQRRLLVADRLRESSTLYGDSSWQYHTLPQSYTVTTNGGNLRVYFKAMTYLHATQSNGGSQQVGLIIHPIIDGEEQEYCDYLYTRGWGTPDDSHGPIVCDATYQLPPGEHTIGFKHRYYGYRTTLYGGWAKSQILIEELPTAIDYQGQ